MWESVHFVKLLRVFFFVLHHRVRALRGFPRIVVGREGERKRVTACRDRDRVCVIMRGETPKLAVWWRAKAAAVGEISGFGKITPLL